MKQSKSRNFVAKHMNAVNRNTVMANKYHDEKRGKSKHKVDYKKDLYGP